MPRLKEFEPETALGRALELFWQRGYEATSIADLVAHLGVARASIYATFGSKHDLYLKALRRYLDTRDAEPVAILSRQGPALPAIRALVEMYVDATLHDENGRGCMVVNAAVERAGCDEDAARLVQRSWDSLETALTMAFTRARTEGELPADRDPRALARFLVVFLQGIRVLGRADADPARIRDAADQALASLR
jgi:TetR/AcrR family transcriptional repressor of nem operon